MISRTRLSPVLFYYGFKGRSLYARRGEPGDEASLTALFAKHKFQFVRKKLVSILTYMAVYIPIIMMRKVHSIITISTLSYSVL